VGTAVTAANRDGAPGAAFTLRFPKALVVTAAEIADAG
jgi:hypothetical protein